MRGACLVALCILARIAEAQEVDGTRPRLVCFFASSAADCRNFIVADLVAGGAFVSSQTPVFSGLLTSSDRRDFDDFRLHWALGLARNVSRRHAIGAAVILDKSDRVFGGAELRFRRWTHPWPAADSGTATSFELSAGYSREGVTRTFPCTGPFGAEVCAFQQGDDIRTTGEGVRIGATITARGVFGVFGRLERLRAQGSTRTGFYVGVSTAGVGALLGSIAAMGLTAVE